MEVRAIKAFYGLGRWWKKGDIIKSDCFTCIQELIKLGKAERL